MIQNKDEIGLLVALCLRRYIKLRRLNVPEQILQSEERLLNNRLIAFEKALEDHQNSNLGSRR